MDLFNKKKAHKKRNSEILPTICAGSFDGTIVSSVETISLTNNKFTDINGEIIKIENYDGFIVKGNSMQFCNILTNDLLLAQKDFKISDLKFPEVIALSNYNVAPEQCKYKLRRAWHICSDKNTNEEFKNILTQIILTPKFQELKSSLREKGIDQTDDLIDDFFDEKNGRLAKYKALYGNEAISLIVISTTYEPKDKKVHFSIHKTDTIVGIVRYVFEVK